MAQANPDYKYYKPLAGTWKYYTMEVSHGFSK